ncbi:MAG: glutamyl-tRNA reductase [Actinomycetota bacterium]
MSSLLVVGVNHRSAPLSVLERLTIAPDHLGKAVAGLAERDSFREATIVSTCNRTEVYVVAELFHGAYADVRDFLSDIGDLGVDQLAPHLFSEHDGGAVRHLLEVASGLDSAVLGESEILGQVRTAWEVARTESAARSQLNLLFRSAVATGKRARTETGIGRGTASISHAAVEMLTDVVGDLAGRHIAVIGAGSMGEGVAVALHKHGGCTIDVVNRSPERGDALAARVGGRSVGIDHLQDALESCDVVIASTGSGEPVITPETVRSAGRGPERPLSIIDIALPRDVDPEVADLDGLTVFDLDDLRDWADRGRVARDAEAERVRAIVAEDTEQYLVDSTARQAAPLVASMHVAAEAIRAGELERFAKKLAGLDAADRRAVDELTRAILAKLLHEPSIRLKTQAGTPQGARNAAAIRDLFDLG